VSAWIREEPALICTSYPRGEEENSILQMMIYAAEDFLKQSVYQLLSGMLDELKKEAA
jgi:hypothetical protein